jgi:hypothetical protein
LLGFDLEELAKLLDPGVRDGLCDPDEVPASPDEAITRPGDLWLLGRHRLLCGDSGKAEDVDRLLDGAAIHLVNTDPPYNVRVEPRSNNAIAAGLSSFQGTTHHQSLDVTRHPEKAQPTTKKLRAKDRPLANDFSSDEQFAGLFHAWFRNLARVLLPGRSFYPGFPRWLCRFGMAFAPFPRKILRFQRLPAETTEEPNGWQPTSPCVSTSTAKSSASSTAPPSPVTPDSSVLYDGSRRRRNGWLQRFLGCKLMQGQLRGLESAVDRRSRGSGQGHLAKIGSCMVLSWPRSRS